MPDAATASPPSLADALRRRGRPGPVSAAAPKPAVPEAKVIAPFKAGANRFLEQVNCAFSVIAEPGTTPEDYAKDMSLWAAFGGEATQCDRFEVKWPDGTAWAEYLVTFSDIGAVRVALLRSVQMANGAHEEDRRLPEGLHYERGLDEDADRHRIVRTADGHLMNYGLRHLSKRDAEQWASQHAAYRAPVATRHVP